DRGTVWAFIIWFFLCIVLTALDIWPIGNAAHGAGLVLGYGAGLAASHTGGAQAAWAGAMAGLLVLTLVAAADLRDAVTLRPKAEVAFEMGTYALDEGELPKAIALLTRAVTLAPDYADAQYNLGVAYQRADQLHAAAAALAQAHELDPENTLFAQHGAWAYSYLAWEAGSRQDHPAAVALYRRALALDPSSPDDWLNLGLNLLGTGDEEAAESAIQQAHELAPDRGDINDHLAQRRLVTALQAFQAGDLATARGLLEEAAALPLQSEEIRRQVTELLTQIRARTPATPSVAP
ncbi:MAG TPA: tetratricopeptide repeat protein, partial [bacterium]|nr:tetratricopeptide repeat protein [bacterium]